MSPAPLHVHIGLHKTGSTSLQSFMVANTELLADHGVAYPSAGRLGGPGHVNLFREVGNLQRFDPDQGTWADVLTLTRRRDVRRVVVSSEDLSMLAPDRIPRLASITADVDLQIVVYLRPQDQLIQSVYAQRCRDGRVTVPFEDFADSTKNERRYRFADLLRLWADNVGLERIAVRPLEPGQLQGGSLLEDFLHVIGEADLMPLMQPVPRRNRSPDRTALEVLRRIAARRADDDFNRTRFAATVGRRVVKAALQLPQTSAPLLSGAAAARLRSQFEAQNSRVARTFLGRGDGQLFLVPPPESDDPDLRDPAHDLTVDYLVALIDELIT